MVFRVYIRHVLWPKSKLKRIDVKSSSTIGAGKKVLNNLKDYGLSFYSADNLGYYVTRVIKLKGEL